MAPPLRKKVGSASLSTGSTSEATARRESERARERESERARERESERARERGKQQRDGEDIQISLRGFLRQGSGSFLAASPGVERVVRLRLWPTSAFANCGKRCSSQ